EVIASEIPVIMHPFQAPHHAGGSERIMERQPDAEFFGATLRTPEPELAAAPVPPRPAPSRYVIPPPVIALLVPTGAGKTTTIAKLATNAQAYGRGRVGLLGLDTYRVGAVEQLETYAQLADLPCEIVYESSDIDRGLRRLVECD